MTPPGIVMPIPNHQVLRLSPSNQIDAPIAVEQTIDPPKKEKTDDNKGAITSTLNPAIHWRVRFIQHSSLAETNRGIPGVTPPFCPAGPPLLREILEEGEVGVLESTARSRSPLRFSATVSETNSAQYAHDPNLRLISKLTGRIVYQSQSMPHAVSTAQSGFQALILCGPGIGLSTFTSVPNEYPKALINVANRPMVWYVLDWCYRMGVTDITLITPPSAKATFAAALAQNPYLTSLPSPSPTLLCPENLEFTTPTAELLRLREVQNVIKSDFLLLPCDLICDLHGDNFLEIYLTNISGLGGVASADVASVERYMAHKFSIGGEGSGRRGGLSIWYNTAEREESVKGEECDFLATAKLDASNRAPINKSTTSPEGTLRKLVWTMPMSELMDQVEEDKGWKIRQSLLRKYGSVKVLTRFRDSHIYFFPYWVKEFAAINPDFESVSEDLVGTWAKTDWRKSGYAAKHGVQQLFSTPSASNLEDSQVLPQQNIEDEIDFSALSSTQTTQHTPNVTSLPSSKITLATRVQGTSLDKITSNDDQSPTANQETSDKVPTIPPILSFILPSSPTAPLIRRVDTTPLLLSVSLLLAKLPSLEESQTTTAKSSSPYSHSTKISSTATIAPRTTISRSDTLIDANTSISPNCVIKSSCIGSNVSIGLGSRITNCVIMDGATVGEKCVLTGTVLGKKVKLGNGVKLTGCEVQDGNVVGDRVEGKGEKMLVGGLEDHVEGEGWSENEEEDDEDGEGENDGDDDGDAGGDESEDLYG